MLFDCILIISIIYFLSLLLPEKKTKIKINKKKIYKEAIEKGIAPDETYL